MPTPLQDRDDQDAAPNALAGVSVERDFDDSWLSKEPPGYEDVDADGQVIEPGGDSPSSGER